MGDEDDTSIAPEITFPSSVRYTLKHELGRGGMGIVFKAERNACGVTDEIVLKTVVSISEQYLKRLKKEANIATALRHENIVKTYGLESISVSKLPSGFKNQVEGLESGVRETMQEVRRRRLNKFLDKHDAPGDEVRSDEDAVEEEIFLICMDYIDGMDLFELQTFHLERDLLLPVPLVGFIISRMCRALGYAHDSIIHRDVSPGNILINRHGVCKLTDFGVAVETDEPVNLVVGKAEYMSPEQLRKEQVDQRSDLFSLGVVAYELLTGVRLFEVPDGMETPEKVEYVRQLHGRSFPPPHKLRPEIPEVFSDLVHKMISRDPEDRPPDAVRTGDALEQEYLYAEGFGPTNNSLAAYIELFESGFDSCSEYQYKQLQFLNTYENSSLRRRLAPEKYTEKGRALIDNREVELPE
jgi:serine/threonine protein kinase